MIKATELRIGNIVNISDIGLVAITGVLPNKIFYTPFLEKQEFAEFLYSLPVYIEPIPLTEDWLVRLGLSSISILNEAIHDPNETYYKTTIAIDGKVYEIKSYHLIVCDYVHQLQNLYHALTGEELTLKQR